MTLSIVIGTRHRPDSLRRCLDSVIGQTVRPDEVVLVDDGALDPAPYVSMLEAAGIAAPYFNKSHDPGLTKSRNLGIRNSRGSIVMFLDDDVVLHPGYIEAILDVYARHPDAGGVGGRLDDEPLAWPKRLLLRFFLLDSKREGAVLPNGVGVLVRGIEQVTDVEWFSGCNMSYRREVFDRFMFDEGFGGNGWGDDRDFSYAVSRSFRLLAAPGAGLLHLEEPRGRASGRDFGQVEIEYVHRFFVKHMPRRMKNVAALWWGFAGIAVKNLLTLKFDRVRGNLAGMAAVMRGRGAGAAQGRRAVLGVLSEQGGSLANLAVSGQAGRFVEQYLGRYGAAFDEVYYFSYADEFATLPAGCTLVGNRWRLQRWLYAVLMPLLHARLFRRCSVLRVMQLTGEVPAIIAKVLYGVPFVATFGYHYARNAGAEGAGAFRVFLFRQRTRLALAMADRVIVTNPRIREEAVRRVGAARVLLIPNAVDTARFAPAPADVTVPGRILCVGRLSPEKNLPLLIQAVARLDRPATIRLVGIGPVTDTLATQAAALGVTLEFAGTVQHQHLPDEYRRAAVFAMTSFSEGHPKALIEAMSCGCVCVGTDVDGIRDVLRHGETGLLAPLDTGAFAGALARALDDQALRDRLSRAARAEAVEHYDISATLAAEIAAMRALGGVQA
jgi:glycosyltransferase involved in cell wall biosynthesis